MLSPPYMMQHFQRTFISFAIINIKQWLSFLMWILLVSHKHLSYGKHPTSCVIWACGSYESDFCMLHGRVATTILQFGCLGSYCRAPDQVVKPFKCSVQNNWGWEKSQTKRDQQLLYICSTTKQLLGLEELYSWFILIVSNHLINHCRFTFIDWIIDTWRICLSQVAILTWR